MKPKIVLLLILIAPPIFIFWQKTSYPASTTMPQVCFKNQCFVVEVADDYFEKIQGLMHRESLPEGYGMLFVYNWESSRSFWMKNMNFPIDIIWIDAESKVVHIKKKAMPCGDECVAIFPARKSKYVLEVNAGASDEIGLKEGDKLEIKL